MDGSGARPHRDGHRLAGDRAHRRRHRTGDRVGGDVAAGLPLRAAGGRRDPHLRGQGLGAVHRRARRRPYAPPRTPPGRGAADHGASGGPGLRRRRRPRLGRR
ncbi:hypothetical protein D7M15_04310 [Streptomyces sp. Z26]|nr:hypothetical protein D7M15_04310 [Streptomyces sp. Z26]